MSTCSGSLKDPIELPCRGQLAMTSRRYVYLLEVADQRYECSCPCSIYRHAVCEGSLEPGRAVAVMRDRSSGSRCSSRCVPCAKASCWVSDVPVSTAATKLRAPRIDRIASGGSWMLDYPAPDEYSRLSQRTCSPPSGDQGDALTDGWAELDGGVASGHVFRSPHTILTGTLIDATLGGS